MTHFSGFLLIVVGAVVFVTAVMVAGFWASEAVVDAIKRRAQDKLSSARGSLPTFLVRRRKAA